MKRYEKFSRFIKATVWIPVLFALTFLTLIIADYIKTGYEWMFMVWVNTILVLIALVYTAIYAACVITDNIIAHMEDRKDDEE